MTDVALTLEATLAQWDGRSSEPLVAVYDRHREDSGFVDHLLTLLALPAAQNGSTWLIKRSLERGRTLSQTEEAQLLGCLDALVDWPARLHALQCLPYLDVPETHVAPVAAFVIAQLKHDRAFVRAWAYGALYRLGQTQPAHAAEAAERVAWALEHEAPSVRARLRQLTGQGG
ncbi:MAG: hypothetical protein AAF460_08170 [Pseudomonadota bacterium]